MKGAVLSAFVLFAPMMAHADPTPQQCVEANEHAIAHRKKLELLAARQALETCASQACPPVIVAECGNRLTEVASVMPSIVFAVKDEKGMDLTDVAITMEGKPFGSKPGAVDVDPGAHTFEFVAPGKPALTRTLVIREGEKDRHEIVALGSLQPRREGGGVRTAGWVLGGVGLAGVVVGSIFGGLAFSENATADQHCPLDGGRGCTDTTGVQAGKDADLSATISTIAFAAGLTCVAAGVVMILVGGPKAVTSARLELAPAGAGMLLRGRF